jgi:hypothetical protein
VRRLLAGNVVARLVALAALGSPPCWSPASAVRPWSAGSRCCACCPGWPACWPAPGLPGAAPYFLAGDGRQDPRVRAALGLLTVAGATLAAAGWLVLTPVLHRAFFGTWSTAVTALAATAVFTQLFVAVGKALLQGSDDMRGANVAIAAEEAAFLPCYVRAAAARPGLGPVLAALVLADVAVSAGIAGPAGPARLLHRLAAARAPTGRPDLRVRDARSVRRHARAAQPPAGRGHPRRAGRAGRASASTPSPASTPSCCGCPDSR